jgi:CRISPR-associated exonuclease Cas4
VPSAGEVEQFVYCAHNWLLAQRGIDEQDAGSRRGVAQHAATGRAARAAEQASKDRRAGLNWSFRILAVAASATFLTLEVLYLRSEELHLIFLTTALVLTTSSAGLLAVALDAEVRERRARKASGLVGDLVDSDLEGEGKVLTDAQWDLRGSPDSLLATESGTIPVELKTGHTPDRPYESHVMQLAVYMRLLEARGEPPPYGLLQYPEGTFRVAWDDEVRARLRVTLDRMKAAKKSGRADRDHQVPGRCRGCEQRLA